MKSQRKRIKKMWDLIVSEAELALDTDDTTYQQELCVALDTIDKLLTRHKLI